MSWRDQQRGHSIPPRLNKLLTHNIPKESHCRSQVDNHPHQLQRDPTSYLLAIFHHCSLLSQMLNLQNPLAIERMPNWELLEPDHSWIKDWNSIGQSGNTLSTRPSQKLHMQYSTPSDMFHCNWLKLSSIRVLTARRDFLVTLSLASQFWHLTQQYGMYLYNESFLCVCFFFCAPLKM